MKKKIIKVLGILLFANNIVFAQVEYFVKINPTTCSYTILDSIPIIKWISIGSSTFDKRNHRYIFNGQDNGTGNYICSIDATNGSTISIPQITGPFGGLKFDNSTGILYGIHWTITTANADFVIINPIDLSYTVIHPINLTGIGGDVTFDDVNHRYILAASDSAGNNCLFSIDVATGTVISKPLLIGINGIQFDNSSGNLYGLHWDNNLQTEYFVSINITTGNLTIINSIPLVTSIVMGYPTFDEINKRYTFRGSDNNNNDYLYTIDATNGQVFSQPFYPAFTSSYNLIETEYDNSTGDLYALHWGPLETSFTKPVIPDIIIPNIFTPNNDGLNDVFKVSTKNVITLNCKIYNRWGILVGELKTIHEVWDGFTTSGQQCTDGVYYCIVEYQNSTGTNSITKGSVQLIR